MYVAVFYLFCLLTTDWLETALTILGLGYECVAIYQPVISFFQVENSFIATSFIRTFYSYLKQRPWQFFSQMRKEQILPCANILIKSVVLKAQTVECPRSRLSDLKKEACLRRFEYIIKMMESCYISLTITPLSCDITWLFDVNDGILTARPGSLDWAFIASL